MTNKPNLIISAVFGCLIGFISLALLDWISACAVNGISTPLAMLSLFTYQPEIFIMKGCLGSVTGLAAGAAWGMEQGDAVGTRGPGLIAFLGGGAALALIMVWVLSFLLPKQIQGIPPLYVAYNICEPTLPAIILMFWGVRRTLTAKSVVNDTPSDSATPPLSSPFS